jgi:manganese oxidase
LVHVRTKVWEDEQVLLEEAKMKMPSRLAAFAFSSCIVFAFSAAGAAGAQSSLCKPENTVYAHVVAIDQPIALNRLGASQPGGMIFALARDVCASSSGQTGCAAGPINAGQVMLKPYKRPRPIVLRVNEQQCLMIGFTNLLSSSSNPYQPATRSASVHVQGMEWVNTTQGVASTCSPTNPNCNDGSWVGNNSNGLVPPSSTPLDPNNPQPQTTYTLYAAKEGAFLLYSTADVYSTIPRVPIPSTAGNRQRSAGGQLAMGLFGAVHVEPHRAEWYRSQVTAVDLAAATKGYSPFNQPLIDYTATYTKEPEPGCSAAGTCRKVGSPVLRMSEEVKSKPYKYEIVHSDLTAVITGPGAGRFPQGTSVTSELKSTYALPDRQQPFREFTIIYHEMFNASQAFAEYYASNGTATGNGEGQDQFGINYGMGGIGSEVLANRIGVGPMANCPSCKFEEFFLTSWAVGDPAMVVDNPAGANCTATAVCSGTTTPCDPINGPACTSGSCTLTGAGTSSISCTGAKATQALYPDDPSNVYHSYISDHTTFRVLHGGVDLHHVHHQHAHQWMHSPDTSDSDYLDSQSIGPGSAFNMEMVFNGSGNVNQAVGDSIFHCHFYPHFAGGMWSLWRVHDVYETGTLLDKDGKPLTGVPNRALPDGEIAAGTPTPAVVPLPTIPMAPMPALVQLASYQGSAVVEVCDNTSTGGPSGQCNGAVSVLSTTGDAKNYNNPGFPFFIPGVGGQRAPHPPLDFAYACSDDPGRTCTPEINAGGKTTKADVSSCKDPKTATCDAKTAALDGGLPRHLILSCQDGVNKCSEIPGLTDFDDFSKTLTKVSGLRLPEDGTFVEQVAMGFHSQRLVDSRTPDNSAWTVNGYSPFLDKGPNLKINQRRARFILNGLPPAAGAPFADPCIRYGLNGGRPLAWYFARRYEAADIQLDLAFNRDGWHFPQQRIISLWGDVGDYLNGTRPPEPFFFRANSGNCIDYVLANLIPNVYELDDFQVRTPTDILGQHIHLVKFDVTSSDGATNGFNYEDGTFAPNEVVERIAAINAGGGLAGNVPKTLTAKPLPFFGPGPGGQWVGAQATIQRWYTDRLFNGQYQDIAGIYVGRGVDRTLRTVFTHDHFGPSTHQQAGLYAGLVIEPAQSAWYHNQADQDDKPFGGCTKANPKSLLCVPVPPTPVKGYNGTTTLDGGPTTWQAVIVPQSDPSSSFREFLLEFQDSTLTYEPFSITQPNFSGFCSDNGAGCTPATAKNPLSSGCSAKAVCYAYGFCSTSVASGAAQLKCTPEPVANYLCGTCPAGGGTCPNNPQLACSTSTSTSTSGILSCGSDTTATCNLVAGVPSTAWGTTPLDSGAGVELITLGNATNSFSVNYRNEPLFLRTDDAGAPKAGKAGDLAYAYTSLDRGFTTGVCSDNHAFCTKDADCKSAKCELKDPVTPLLRAYAGDDVQVRTLVGAHINPHNFTMHGVKWLEEPSFVDSGWRNSEVMGISEHFEEIFKLPSFKGAGNSDYLYMPGAANIEQAGGNWGILRAYPAQQAGLKPLPQNANPKAAGVCPDGKRKPYTVVALTANQALATHGLVYSHRSQSATNQAVMADPNAILYFQLADLDCTQPSPNCKAKSGKPEPLVLRANAGDCMEVTLYNGLPQSICSSTGQACTEYGQSCDSGNGTCLMYGYCSNDFTKTCTPQNATAQCGTGNTCNQLFPGSAAPSLTSVTTYNQCGQAASSNAACTSNTSVSLGLHPQLVTFDVTNSNGFNVGTNGDQLAQPGQSKTYTWYAGNIDPTADNPFIPIEFGAANLLPSDNLNHYQYGLFGALVIEPKEASCMVNGKPMGIESCTGTTAQIVSFGGSSFREFVLITQDGLQGPPGPGNPAPFTFRTAVIGGDAFNAVNYHFEPLNSNITRQCGDGSSSDVSCVLSSNKTMGGYCCNGLQGGADDQSCTFGPCNDPQTPTFTACAGEQVRFRILHPGGINTNHVFELHGHVWQEQPYMSSGKGCPIGLESPTTHTNLYSSSVIGSGNLCDQEKGGPASEFLEEQDVFSEYQGSRIGHGPTNHFDLLVQAGGTDKVPGDYLYRSFPADHFGLGLWGIFRVNDCKAGQTGTGTAAAAGGGGGH